MNKRVVALNTIIQFGGKLFSIIVNLLIVYLLTHHFSLQEFGEYTTVLSYLLFFNILADLGLSTILVRDIHEYHEKDKPTFIGNVIIMRTASLILSLFIGVMLAQFIPQYNFAIKIGILIGSASTFFLLMSFLLFSVFQIHLKMQKAVYSNAVGILFNLIFVIIFIKFNLSVDYAILAVSLGYGAMFLFALIQALKLQKISFKIDREIWLKVWLPSLTIGGSIIFSSIYFKIDSVILSLMKPYSAVSIYGVPYKILEVLISFPQMFMAPIFALMAKEMNGNNTERFKKMFQKSFDFLIIAGLPIIPGAYFLSKATILLYAGPNYSNSIEILKILSYAIALSFAGSSFIFVVLLSKKQHYLLIWNIVLSIFNIVMNIIFIPRYSYYASAWITVATEALVFTGSFYFIKRAINFTPDFKILLKGTLATIGFTISLYLFSRINFILQAFISLIIYSLLLLALKIITRDDIKEVLGH